jgi:hypothetical protein
VKELNEANPHHTEVQVSSNQSTECVFLKIVHALPQVTEIRMKASDERMRETNILLADLAEQRQIAQDAVTAEVLLRKQQLHNNR